MSKLFGPAAEEVGFALQDQVRFYRTKNQFRNLGKVQHMIREAGLEPKVIPLRIFLPLLEGASLEDKDFTHRIFLSNSS